MRNAGIYSIGRVVKPGGVDAANAGFVEAGAVGVGMGSAVEARCLTWYCGRANCGELRGCERRPALAPWFSAAPPQPV